MKKKLAIIALSLMTAIGGVAPAQAFPTVSAPKVEAPLDVQNVQWREGWTGPRFDGDRRYWRGRNYGPRRYYGDRYYGDRNYGRRYYRDRGPNVGAVLGGLAAGAIIGGALAQPSYAAPPQRYVSGGNSHVNWCYARYRSYRAYDNTFQPYNGPRQQCYSPY